MKTKIIIFILFVVGWVACAPGLVDGASDCAGADCLEQYEREVSPEHEYHSSVPGDIVADNPVRSILFAHCDRIHSGQVRAFHRCTRLMYRYSPVAFLKGGKVVDFAVTRHFQSNRNVCCPVKLSESHGFIRLRKLLI